MNIGLKKSSPDDSEISVAPEIQQEKINEVRRLIGPQSGKLALFCSDACILRYLRARNWNVKKAVKMLKSSLKWRLEFKPEDIHWDDVAKEADTGKIYRANYKDKYGRPVLVMRPSCQNTKSVKGQMKYLVYCMEKAILNLPEDQEQMVWLIDFHGFNMSHISIKVTKETAHVLQDQYPERLGIAILYNPPKIFEPFWKIAKPFLEPKTANKVNFVYSDNSDTNKIMHELFNMELVESAFGGKDVADFDINKYAEIMREDDERTVSFRQTNNTLAGPLPPAVITPSSSDLAISESALDAAVVKLEKSLSTADEDGDYNMLVDESLQVKNS